MTLREIDWDGIHIDCYHSSLTNLRKLWVITEHKRQRVHLSAGILSPQNVLSSEKYIPTTCICVCAHLHIDITVWMPDCHCIQFFLIMGSFYSVIHCHAWSLTSIISSKNWFQGALGTNWTSGISCWHKVKLQTTTSNYITSNDLHYQQVTVTRVIQMKKNVIGQFGLTQFNEPLSILCCTYCSLYV